MVTSHTEYDDHELISFCRDAEAGLTGIIAVHDTAAGPAMGGCRMATYRSVENALTDVLRLSKGMSYKNIMAGLPYGGGKAVIIADPRTQKTPQLLTAFARNVERLNGSFITGEDVGTTVADIQLMRRYTGNVRGIPENGPGDPSPMTALGTFHAIEAAVRHRLGASDLKDIRVVVQGLGAVGMRLAALLHDAGASLVVSDIDPARVEDATARFDATPALPTACHLVDADVYAPCALGATLNESNIAELRATVVAGAANNQLATPEDGRRLADKGVLYAPDYVVNAGGVISTALEGLSFNHDVLMLKVATIASTLQTIFARADHQQLPTSVVADRMAQERLAAARAERAIKLSALDKYAPRRDSPTAVAYSGHDTTASSMS